LFFCRQQPDLQPVLTSRDEGSIPLGCTKIKEMNIVNKIIDYESGELQGFGVLELYAELIKTGTILHLQGSYQRQARSFIEDGIINQSGEIEMFKAEQLLAMFTDETRE
jgi:hypothetical protein